MLIVLALAPIALLLLLLLALRWSAAASGFASASVAFAVAFAAFGFGRADPLATLLGPVAEAAFTAATILWIIFGALWLHEYQIRTGAIDQIRASVRSISGDRQSIALLVAWFFALFLEGAAGFGTPVALAAPLLVGLGFPPVKALVLVLIGHSVGVSFGAMGTTMAALLSAGDAALQAVPAAVALLHALLGWALVLVLARFASEGDPLERPPQWRRPMLAAASFLLPFFLIAWAVGPELPTLLGALTGAVIFVVLTRSLSASETAQSTNRRLLLLALIPYLSAAALVLLTRLVPPLRLLLQSESVEWTLFDRFNGSFAPFYHPGTLICAALVATAIFCGRGKAASVSAARAARRLPSVALALFSVLLLARVSLHSGMVETIAAAAAGGVGIHWAGVAPAIGALGSFVTGSATASNLLFADLQLSAAASAGASPLLAATGQGFGAAAGNMIAPHNIVAGAATVGLVGAEGRVIRRTIIPCLAYILAGGALLWLAGIWMT